MLESLGLHWQPDRERYTLPCFLDDVAKRHGPREALRFEPSAGTEPVSLRYEDLRRDARRLARGLVGAGVVKGARVAVLMANRPEWVVSAFAVALVGGVLVPVNTFATGEERDYILRHSDASLLLMQPTLLRHDFRGDLADRHPELVQAAPGRLRCAELPALRRVVCLGSGADAGGFESWDELVALGEDVDDALLDALSSEVRPSDDGLLIYTSGTTAHPKGVLHRQRAPVIQSWRFGEDLALAPEDRVLTAQPFFWTAGICMSLGASLAAGACLLVAESFDAGRYLARIESERATTLHAWPHQEKALAEHPDARRRDLSSLRKIEFSSPLAPLAGLTQDLWGSYGSYGLSETFTLAASLPSWAPAEARSGTSGRPLPGMRIEIVDVETGEPLHGVGEKGEIAVRGVTLMRGYYKLEPELYLDARGFFHTQDGGCFDADGLLHWSGRLSNLIKTGGANVSPLEIEKALEASADVRLAQAVGVPHPSLGEAIVLCVVPTKGCALDGEALRERLRASLAAYKVPKRVLFFAEEELSFTANQKLQVAPLRELALARLAKEGAVIEGFRYGAA